MLITKSQSKETFSSSSGNQPKKTFFLSLRKRKKEGSSSRIYPPLCNTTLFSADLLMQSENWTLHVPFTSFYIATPVQLDAAFLYFVFGYICLSICSYLF
ncbi:Chloride channel protein ClC-Kb [Dirofilaria immitis]